MADTFDSVWRAAQMRCPMAGPLLTQQWTNYVYKSLAERRPWAFLQGYGQFLVNDVYNTGTVAGTFGSTTITGTGTAFDASMLWRQFRTGRSTPVYDIVEITDATHLEISLPYGGPTQSGLGYQIYNAYLPVPDDFNYFVSIWDPQYAWRLWHNITQQELNMWDPQRTNQGTAWVVSARTFTPSGQDTPQLPRYELWPGQLNAKPYPYLYTMRADDLNSGDYFPNFIRGDVIMKGVMSEISKWPGPSSEKKNPYFNLQNALILDKDYHSEIYQLERNDDELRPDDVWYGQSNGLPMAPLPWADAKFLQSHDF